MHLSQAVCRLREHVNQSQRDFARTLGVSFFSVQKYEHGRPETPEARLLVALLTTAMDQSRPDLVAVFERELMAVLSPPPGFAVEIILKRTKGKRL